MSDSREKDEANCPLRSDKATPKRGFQKSEGRGHPLTPVQPTGPVRPDQLRRTAALFTTIGLLCSSCSSLNQPIAPEGAEDGAGGRPVGAGGAGAVRLVMPAEGGISGMTPEEPAGSSTPVGSSGSAGSSGSVAPTAPMMDPMYQRIKSFVIPYQRNLSYGEVSLALGDFDGDKDIDVAVFRPIQFRANIELFVLYAEANGTFSDPQ